MIHFEGEDNGFSYTAYSDISGKEIREDFAYLYNEDKLCTYEELINDTGILKVKVARDNIADFRNDVIMKGDKYYVDLEQEDTIYSQASFEDIFKINDLDKYATDLWEDMRSW